MTEDRQELVLGTVGLLSLGPRSPFSRQEIDPLDLEPFAFDPLCNQLRQGGHRLERIRFERDTARPLP